MSGKKASPRVKPPGRRKDPEPRPTDPAGEMAHLVNKDPAMHYVLVNKETPDVVANYLNQGYAIESWEGFDEQGDPVGVSPLSLYSAGRDGKLQEGDQLIVAGNFVMSIPKEEKERIYREGVYGNSGQNAADELKKKMIRGRVGQLSDDPMRGLHSRYAHLQASHDHRPLGD